MEITSIVSEQVTAKHTVMPTYSRPESMIVTIQSFRKTQTNEKIPLYPEEGDTAGTAFHDAFQADNGCYTIEDTTGNTVVNPKGTLYMTANSASGSKFYELIPTQQDYIAKRSQNWLPSYSVIDMDSDSFSITTYQITAEGKVEAIDDTFTIEKTAAPSSINTLEADRKSVV